MELTTLDYVVDGAIARVTMNRPAELNTMNKAFWTEIIDVFAAIDADPAVRVVIIASTGRHFTAGLDLGMASASIGAVPSDPGRARESFRRHVKHMQDSFTVVDKCRVPVIAVVQGGCIGGGVDFVTACDLRLCTEDAFFTIQEVNIAIVADVGTLQRIPYLLPQGLVRELAYTGRRFPAAEARQYGFVNSVAADHAAALVAADALAQQIAAKSPLVIAGIKQVLNEGRDLTIAQGLEYVAVWNSGMLQGEDVPNAVKAQMAKQPAVFADLIG
ncbi:crotonase/enoyl-CoA hydratase family protein [Polymorphobacter fuscus]|uniref:Crotonase/enoyl-CoA hydratase family protein n=1 Tax=Sandarakinorhabdus fusca TaxID=1439888 RepID=A0A7C9KW75_9SPHN|nr:crotonase/enoyl-CoA hydratase family protein [Polymorphobacter fuscus]KAB7647505.1 crotonase/enoyl-CoA hydratase family protein [Polymorphobacter fuscus]MQT16765.1 crotonase/enoyl-CoA hydratase family protein [Polymorphobacter fuscus]NJC09247.1 enoyl-CoA hydratase [Polymorphobacter fuscus]